MKFDWVFAAEVTPTLVKALGTTVLATILGSLLAAGLGLIWVLLRRSPIRVLSWSTHYCVEFVRCTPLLVQIYFFFYILPDTGIRMSPLTTGVLALGLHYSAYLAEVYRAGIDAVPRGQWEAARALNLGPGQTWRHVILPQALPPILPVMGNYVIAMFKDTPMLSAITVLELLQTSKIIGSETFRYLEPLTIAGALFLVVSLIASAGVRVLEQKLAVRGAV